MPPISFHEPLLLREFFFTMASKNPGLHKMANNPLSVQFPWEENAEGLQRWKQVFVSSHFFLLDFTFIKHLRVKQNVY